ncbi:hypothetical protein CVT24_009875 [Panaeolus cyanescens]|uniref:Uncharacterized protein n=1 Tax=Panaeolus cyanescens TaxID=181874 RepID=A0A409VXR8_9AGAR|nr:hypothetical protein CVT24_009875 [Panaeolus cyanescens]
MDSGLTMIGLPVTIQHNSYPSWPDLKYPAKKADKIHSSVQTSPSFSSFTTRPLAASRSGSESSSSVCSDGTADLRLARVFPATRKNIDDTLTSSYLLSLKKDSSRGHLLCPPVMTSTKSPLARRDDDTMSPLQRSMAAFAEYDKEYQPPFKAHNEPSSVDSESDDLEYRPSNNRRPPRKRVASNLSTVASHLSSSGSEEGLSTPFTSNPSSWSSASTLATSYLPTDLRSAKINQTSNLPVTLEGEDLDSDDDEILIPHARRGSSAEPEGPPKTRVVKFDSSSTRYFDYKGPGKTVLSPNDTIDQFRINDQSISARALPSSSVAPSSYLDFIDASKTVTGRARSGTSASAPPSLPTVAEELRTSPHSCNDFASSMTSLENNVSTCSLHTSIHGTLPEDLQEEALYLPPGGSPARFKRGRSLSESVAETIKKKGEGVAKSARYQWFYVTLQVRLKASQAKTLVKKTSFKQMLRRVSKMDLKKGD